MIGDDEPVPLNDYPDWREEDTRVVFWRISGLSSAGPRWAASHELARVATQREFGRILDVVHTSRFMSVFRVRKAASETQDLPGASG